MKRKVWLEAYKNMVTLAVLEAIDMVGEGGGFTINDLAAHFELRLTHNLRTRLEELCNEGTLERQMRYLPSNHMGFWYHAPLKPIPWSDEPTQGQTEDIWNDAILGSY